MEVGDKVKIIGRRVSDGIGCHEFELGGVGVVQSVNEDYAKVKGVVDYWAVSDYEVEVVSPEEDITAVTRHESEWCVG